MVSRSVYLISLPSHSRSRNKWPVDSSQQKSAVADLNKTSMDQCTQSNNQSVSPKEVPRRFPLQFEIIAIAQKWIDQRK